LLSDDSHGTFLREELFDSGTAVVRYVYVCSWFAVVSSVFSVPALFDVVGVEYQCSRPVVDVEFVVFEIISREGLEDIVGLESRSESVGEPHCEDAYGNVERGVARAPQLVACGQRDEDGVLAEVGEGEDHGAECGSVAVAEVPERCGAVFGQVGELDRRVLGVDIVGS